MDLFNFDWFNDCVISGDDTRDEMEIKFKDYKYPMRFGTSPYSGYIITMMDLDTKDAVSFNCDKCDIVEEHLDSTYLSLRNRFSINSNGAHYSRKNIRLVSVTVPKERFLELVDEFGENITMDRKEYEKKILY